MSTPRFTLPDPDRAEAPALPPELLTHILKLAQAGKSSAEQLKIRLTFEQVCKAWFMCDFRWRVVALKDFSAAESLLDTFDSISSAEAAPAGSSSGAAGGASAGGEAMAARVRTVYLRTSKAQVEDKTTKLARLFSLMKNVTSVEIFIDDEGLGKSRDVLDDGITTALAGLGKVKHFKLTGPRMDMDHWYNRGMTDALIRLIPRWKVLESLHIANCELGLCLAKGQKLSPSPVFESFKLSRCGSQLSRLKFLVGALPLTTRELEIDDDMAFVGQKPVKALTDEAINVAKTLKVVKLTAGRYAPGVTPYGGLRRGQMDEFVASLESVTDLALNPCAVNNLGSLADLKKLAHLEILNGLNYSQPSPAQAELIELLKRSTSLKRVVAHERLADDWNFGEALDVVELAGEKEIDLEWVDSTGWPVDVLLNYDVYPPWCPECGLDCDGECFL